MQFTPRGRQPSQGEPIEREQLQDLNTRLNFYILQVRERDATVESLKQSLQSIRDKAAEEIDDLKRKHAREQAALTNSREDYVVKLSKAEDALAKAQEQLQYLFTNQEADKQIASSYKKKYDEEHEEMVAAKQELDRLEREVAKMKDENAQLKHQTYNQEKSGKKLHSDLAAALAELSQARERERALRDDANRLHTDLGAEIDRLKDELAKADRKAVMDKDRDEKERAAQEQKLAEDMRNLQDRMKQDQENTLQALKNEYQDMVDSYRDKLQELGHSLAKAQKDLTEAERLLAQEREQRKKWQQMFRALQDKYDKKVREFEQLMDVKAGFTMEMQQMKRLMDEEDARYATSAVKRPRFEEAAVPAETSTPSEPIEETTTSSEPEPEPLPTHPLALAGDDQGHAITVRNQTEEVQSLKDYALRSKTHNVTFQLPHIELQPGQTLTVKVRQPKDTMTDEGTAEGETAAEADEGVVYVEENQVFNVSGDTVELVDAENQVVGNLSIGAEPQETSKVKQGRSCAVM